MTLVTGKTDKSQESFLSQQEEKFGGDATRATGIIAASAIGLVAILHLSPLVAANPVGMTGARFEFWWQALLAIGIANFGVNLLLISSILYLIVRIKGRESGEFSPMQWGFLGHILGANLIITVCGALIDFLVFYGPTSLGYEYLPRNPEVQLDSLFLGSLLVAASVLIACIFVIRLKQRFSLITAGAMGTASLLAWVFTVYLALVWLLLVLVVALFSALFVVPMYLLMKWHSKAYDEPSSENEGVSLDSQRILRCNLLCLLGVGLVFTGWLVDEALFQFHSTAGDGGWLLILMAATLGFVSPLASGGFLLFFVIVSDSAGIAGFGFQVSTLATFIMLSSFAYPICLGYERRRCALDRLLTFRTIPAFGQVEDRLKTAASGSAD